MPISTNPQRDLNVIINQGADFVRDYEIEDGSPIDLTGATVSCAFTNDFSGAAVFTATCSVLDGPNGIIRVLIPAAATAAAEPSTDINRFTNVGNKVQPQLNHQHETLAFEVFVTGAAAAGDWDGIKFCPVFGTALFYPSAQH